MLTVRTLFYDDPAPEKPLANSVFLAGPTLRGHGRTLWREEALNWFEDRGFMGTIIVPEFDQTNVMDRFGTSTSPVPGMKDESYNVLVWETAGIENSTVTLFWMPFSAIDKLPGYTTRAEVSREIQRDSSRIVLGMPQGAQSGSHIRYHAHRAGLPVHETLEQTMWAALERAVEQPRACARCLKPVLGPTLLCGPCFEANRL